MTGDDARSRDVRRFYPEWRFRLRTVGSFLSPSFLFSILVVVASVQGLCYEGKGLRCARVLDNNGTHANVDITDRLSIADPVQVTRKHTLTVMSISWGCLAMKFS